MLPLFFVFCVHTNRYRPVIFKFHLHIGSKLVSFKNYPPKIIIISRRGQTPLSEDEINMLDWAEIETVDVSINPSSWEVNGAHGIKAYLKSIYVTIVEDELDEKYYDVPDSALSSITDDAI